MNTNDLLKLTASEILAIDVSKPEKIFTESNFSIELRRLNRKWHPDVNKSSNANDVFVHINALGKVAKERIKNNAWNSKDVITFTTQKNKTYRFKFMKQHPFELGQCYIGKSKIAYVINEANDDLYKNGIKAISSIKYPTKEFSKEFSKLFPNVIFNDKTDIGNVVVIDKPKNAIMLKDIIEYLPNKKIDPKHVAWIVGCLYNITAFLDHVKLCHNAITLSTVFVDPAQHSVFLLGGWWYMTKAETKLKAIPKELLKILPNDIFDDKLSKTQYDRIAVKGVAIGCLGDPSLVGSRLLADKAIPKPMLDWVRMSSSLNAIEEYRGWDDTMKECYGKRKFVEFKININDVY